jgi:hypothetical protein
MKPFSSGVAPRRLTTLAKN